MHGNIRLYALYDSCLPTGQVELSLVQWSYMCYQGGLSRPIGCSSRFRWPYARICSRPCLAPNDDRRIGLPFFDLYSFLTALYGLAGRLRAGVPISPIKRPRIATKDHCFFSPHLHQPCIQAVTTSTPKRRSSTQNRPLSSFSLRANLSTRTCSSMDHHDTRSKPLTSINGKATSPTHAPTNLWCPFASCCSCQIMCAFLRRTEESHCAEASGSCRARQRMDSM